MLKTFGFVPRQVSAVIAWQATTVVAVAVILGVPLGLAAGRLAWAAVAGGIGVVVQEAVPWLWFLAVVGSAVLLANLVAVGPAYAAGGPPGHAPRTRPLRGRFSA